MTTYAYTANIATPAASANIATDKVRIATSNAAIQYTTSYPNVALTGTVTCTTNSSTITKINVLNESSLKNNFNDVICASLCYDNKSEYISSYFKSFFNQFFLY